MRGSEQPVQVGDSKLLCKEAQTRQLALWHGKLSHDARGSIQAPATTLLQDPGVFLATYSRQLCLYLLLQLSCKPAMWDEATVARARSRLDDVAKQLSKELGFQVALRMPPAKFNPRLVQRGTVCTLCLARKASLKCAESQAQSDGCSRPTQCIPEQ